MTMRYLSAPQERTARLASSHAWRAGRVDSFPLRHTPEYASLLRLRVIEESADGSLKFNEDTFLRLIRAEEAISG